MMKNSKEPMPQEHQNDEARSLAVNQRLDEQPDTKKEMNTMDFEWVDIEKEDDDVGAAEVRPLQQSYFSKRNSPPVMAITDKIIKLPLHKVWELSGGKEVLCFIERCPLCRAETDPIIKVVPPFFNFAKSDVMMYPLNKLGTLRPYFGPDHLKKTVLEIRSDGWDHKVTQLPNAPNAEELAVVAEWLRRFGAGEIDVKEAFRRTRGELLQVEEIRRTLELRGRLEEFAEDLEEEEDDGDDAF